MADKCSVMEWICRGHPMLGQPSSGHLQATTHRTNTKQIFVFLQESFKYDFPWDISPVKQMKQTDTGITPCNISEINDYFLRCAAVQTEKAPQ